MTKDNHPDEVVLVDSGRRSDMYLADERTLISDAISRIGGKWSVHAMLLLDAGPLRFGELRVNMVGVSQRMLTIALRGLERDGLVARTVFPVIPPKVEYELTPVGRSLLAIVIPIGGWAIENQKFMIDARDKFDGNISSE